MRSTTPDWLQRHPGLGKHPPIPQPISTAIRTCTSRICTRAGFSRRVGFAIGVIPPQKSGFPHDSLPWVNVPNPVGDLPAENEPDMFAPTPRKIRVDCQAPQQCAVTKCGGSVSPFTQQGNYLPPGLRGINATAAPPQPAAFLQRLRKRPSSTTPPANPESNRGLSSQAHASARCRSFAAAAARAVPRPLMGKDLSGNASPDAQPYADPRAAS